MAVQDLQIVLDFITQNKEELKRAQSTLKDMNALSKDAERIATKNIAIEKEINRLKKTSVDLDKTISKTKKQLNKLEKEETTLKAQKKNEEKELNTISKETVRLNTEKARAQKISIQAEKEETIASKALTQSRRASTLVGKELTVQLKNIAYKKLEGIKLTKQEVSIINKNRDAYVRYRDALAKTLDKEKKSNEAKKKLSQTSKILADVNKRQEVSQNKLANTQKILKKTTQDLEIISKSRKNTIKTVKDLTKKYNDVLKLKKQLQDNLKVSTSDLEKRERQLVSVIKQQTDVANKRIESFRKQFARLKGPIQILGEMSRLFSRLAITIGTVVIAFNTLERLFLRVGRNFEEAVIRIGSIADATQEQIEFLGLSTRQIAKDTIFTATQITEAQTVLAQAGLETNEIIETTRAAVYLAGGTLSDLNKVTSLLVSTIKTFGADFSEAGNIADIFAEAVTSSKLTIDSLTESMKFGGSAGAAFGFTIEETVTALAQFVDIGLAGSRAGTALRQSLNYATRAGERAKDTLATLVPITDEETKGTKKLGIEFSKINPKINNFADIVQNLAKYELDAAQAIKIFGLRAGPAIKTIIDRVRLGILDVQEFTAALTEATDIQKAQQLYVKLTDTVNAKLKLLKSAAEELQIALFNAIGEQFGDLIEESIIYVKEMGIALRDMPEEVPIVKFLRNMINVIKENIDNIFSFIKSIIELITLFSRLIIEIINIISKHKELAKTLSLLYIAYKLIYGSIFTLTTAYKGLNYLLAQREKLILKNILDTKLYNATLGKSIIATNTFTFAVRGLNIALKGLRLALGIIGVLGILASIVGSLYLTFGVLKKKVDSASTSFGDLDDEMKKTGELTDKQKDKFREISTELGVWIDSEEKLKKAIKERALILKGSIKDLEQLELIRILPTVDIDKIGDAFKELEYKSITSTEEILNKLPSLSMGFANIAKNAEFGFRIVGTATEEARNKSIDNINKLKNEIGDIFNNMATITDEESKKIVDNIVKNFANMNDELKRSFDKSENEIVNLIKEIGKEYNVQVTRMKNLSAMGFKGVDVTGPAIISKDLAKKVADGINKAIKEINKLSKEKIKIDLIKPEDIRENIPLAKEKLMEVYEAQVKIGHVVEENNKLSKELPQTYSDTALGLLENEKELKLMTHQLNKIRSSAGRDGFRGEIKENEKAIEDMVDSIGNAEKSISVLGKTMKNDYDEMNKARTEYEKAITGGNKEQIELTGKILDAKIKTVQMDNDIWDRLTKSIIEWRKLLRNTLDRNEELKKGLEIIEKENALDAAKRRSLIAQLTLRNVEYQLLREGLELSEVEAIMVKKYDKEKLRSLSDRVIAQKEELDILIAKRENAKKEAESDVTSADAKKKYVKLIEDVRKKELNLLQDQIALATERNKQEEARRKVIEDINKLIENSINFRITRTKELAELEIQDEKNRLNKILIERISGEKNYAKFKEELERKINSKVLEIELDRNRKTIELNKESLNKIGKDIEDKYKKINKELAEKKFSFGITEEKDVAGIGEKIEKQRVEDTENLLELNNKIKDTVKEMDLVCVSLNEKDISRHGQLALQLKHLKSQKQLLEDRSKNISYVLTLVDGTLKLQQKQNNVQKNINDLTSDELEKRAKIKDDVEKTADNIQKEFNRLSMGEFRKKVVDAFDEVEKFNNNLITKLIDSHRVAGEIIPQELENQYRLVFSEIIKAGEVNAKDLSDKFGQIFENIKGDEVFKDLIKFLSIIIKHMEIVSKKASEPIPFLEEWKDPIDVARNTVKQFANDLEGATRVSEFLGNQLSKAFKTFIEQPLFDKIDEYFGIMSEKTKEQEETEERLHDARLQHAQELRELEREITNERMEALMQLEQMEQEMRGRNLTDEEARAELLTQINENLRDVHLGTIEERQLKLEELKGQIDNLNQLENRLGMSRSQIELSSIAMLGQLKNATKDFYDDKLAYERRSLKQKQKMDLEEIKSEGDKINAWAQYRSEFVKSGIQLLTKFLATKLAADKVEVASTHQKTIANVGEGTSKVAAESAGWATPIGAIAIAASFAMSLLALINSLKRHKGGPIEAFEEGGIINGRPGIDKNLRFLDVGGFVVNAESTRKHRKELDAMMKFNNGGKVPARVTKGEYYMPPRQSEIFRNELRNINANKYQTGGSVTPAAPVTTTTPQETRKVEVNLKWEGVNIISGESEEAVRTLYQNQIRELILEDMENKQL